MATITLKAQPLTREAFAPFGDVIETAHASHFGMNTSALERFYDLAAIDIGAADGGRPVVSITRCNTAAKLPVTVTLVERHPLGTQAFIPITQCIPVTPLVIVVARPGESVQPVDLQAFVSNGHQGINYHRGVWHMPMIALHEEQQFLIIDRGGPGENCDERFFEDTIILTAE